MSDETNETEVHAELDKDHSNHPGVNALSKTAIECFVAGVEWGQSHLDVPLPDVIPEEVEAKLFELIKHRYREVELALKIAGALELGQLLNKEAGQREISEQDADWAVDVAAQEYLRLKSMQTLLPIARALDIDVSALSKAEVIIAGGAGTSDDQQRLKDALGPFLTVRLESEG